MKILKKFIPIIVIISLFISYIMPIKVYADTAEEQLQSTLADELDHFSEADDWLGALDGIVGVLTWVFRVPFAIFVVVGETIVSQVIMEGNLPEAGWIIDMEDIIFSGGYSEDVTNQVNLLDTNYFDFSDTESEMHTVKEQVAKWYYIIRNIAIGISLLVLIYIGIRMAISAIAEEKARYKSMIKDWLVGFVLLFTLHLLMVVILNFNSRLVGIIHDAGGLNAQLGGYESALMRNMFSPSLVIGIGSWLIVLIMFGMKIAFFWMYLKRVFTIGFLIVISPLITITYSIDKLGDGKSQALGTWMREFIYNLLIQPFHCIIYLVFVSAGISMLETGALRGILFSCAGMLFMFKAEEIVKHIFGFGRAGSLGKLSEAMAIRGLISGSSKSSAGTSGGGSSPAAGAVQGGGTPSGSNVRRGAQRGLNAARTSSGGMTPTANGGSTPTANGGSTPTANGGATPTANTAGGTTPLLGANATNTSSQYSLDNATTKDKIRSKLNQIKSDPKQAAKGALGNAGLRVKALAAKGTAGMTKAVPKVMAGAIASGMSGSGITGYAIGSKFGGGRFTRAVSNPLDAKSEEYNAQIASNQEASMQQALYDQEERDLIKNVQNAYDEYRNWHPGEDIADKTEEFLYDDPDDKQGLEYAKSLRDLNEFYERENLNGSEDRVIDTVDQMILGKNKPVVKAVDNLIDSGSLKYQDKDKLENNTNSWMATMDRSAIQQERIQQAMEAKQQEIDSENDSQKKKQKQAEMASLRRQYDASSYLNSGEFERLDSDEQKLARKIYMSKKNLETQYSSTKPELAAGETPAQARQRQREESRTKANAEIAGVISKSYDRKKKA